MLEVSHSSCSMARSCPMKYKLRYVDGYKPIRKSTALTLGEVLHLAFDKYYTGMSDSAVAKFIVDTMDEYIANASLTEREGFEVMKATLSGMWHFYPNKNLSQFSEIVSEKEFKIPFGDTMFVGKSDRLLKYQGKWWVGELKTTGLPLQAFKNRMSVSDQVTAYVYAWQQQGYDVQGVIFDYVKKPLLRKSAKDNCSDYCQRIFKDYGVNQNMYFGRHFEYRSAGDVERWVKDTSKVVDTIKGIWNGSYYRNTDSCFNYNAECPYKKICFTDKPDPLTLQLYFEEQNVHKE